MDIAKHKENNRKWNSLTFQENFAFSSWKIHVVCFVPLDVRSRSENDDQEVYSSQI